MPLDRHHHQQHFIHVNAPNAALEHSAELFDFEVHLDDDQDDPRDAPPRNASRFNHGGLLSPDALKCNVDQVFGVPVAGDITTEMNYQQSIRHSVDPQLAATTIQDPQPGRRAPSALELSGAVIIRNHGLRASEIARKQRKERHNANERRRTNAARDRIRDMRDKVSMLERQRVEMSANTHRNRHATAIVTDIPELGRGAPSQSSYIVLADAVDRLRREKLYLEDRIDQYDAQDSIVQGFLAELSLGTNEKPVHSSSSTCGDDKQQLGDGHKKQTCKKKYRTASNGSDTDDNGDDADFFSAAECAPTYLKVLFDSPLTTDEAFGWVKQSYDDIMTLKSHTQFDSSGSTIFGWSDRRVIDAECLQFMFNQDFADVLSSQLVHKTWSLLTTMKHYRLIQPRTRGLKILQRISDDCVVVRLSVASTADDVFHTIMVVARGRIDNGYLISYRSIPLSEAQTQFVEGEHTYVSVFNWFMFVDKPDQDDNPVCEVIFGGRVANRSSKYLRYLTMEVVAGVVRWQSAVGQSKFQLTTSGSA